MAAATSSPDLLPIAPQVSTEAVLAADPQVIITAEPGARASEALAMWQRFPTLAATRRQQFVTLDADRINRHGPRLADEIAVLCAAIERTRAGIDQVNCAVRRIARPMMTRILELR